MRRFIQSFAGWLHRWTIGWFTRQQPPKKRSSRQQRLHLESLEDRRVFAAGFAEFIDPNPAPGNQFGDSVVPLSTGNVVITSPYDDAGGPDAGAVYLFNGRTGKLISTLTGSQPDDSVGSSGVVALPNGNFVVASWNWDNGNVSDASALTWGSGTSGISGIVNSQNSLVGTREDENFFGIDVLPNGNYVVTRPFWDSDSVVDAGAVTFGDGTVGTSGPVSESNSLVGSHPGDMIAAEVKVLTNGNYVVKNPHWDNGDAVNAGAVTWGSGTFGVRGEINESNSLVGGTAGDFVGFDRIAALANGNYVVTSSYWSDGSTLELGAVTWGSGTEGIKGRINEQNSLIGSSARDRIGLTFNTAGATPLQNGNYVVVSAAWNSSRGAVTFGDGSTGARGKVTSQNSLVGSTPSDLLGYFGITELANGNYVVNSQSWDNGLIKDAGAVTWGSGTNGISGEVGINNSLIGDSPNDRVGSGTVTPLSNGNYIVGSRDWDNGAAIDAGAVTWGDGTSGIVGTIDENNSLVGSSNGDKIGDSGITALRNGNYVVNSQYWHSAAGKSVGAATFGNGTTGIHGYLDATNSFVGSTENDLVGNRGAVALANGNYVVISSSWGNLRGAVTFGDGTAGVVGQVETSNSLVGTNPGEEIGKAKVVALSNGGYVVMSPGWENTLAKDTGAVTFGNGAGGIFGRVSASNSLVGSTENDQIGVAGTVVALLNGSFLVRSKSWDNGLLQDAGAVTFGDGKSVVAGVINPANSAIGEAANTDLQTIVVDNVNQSFYAIFLDEGGGRVRVGSQIDGFSHPWHLAVEPHDVNNDGHVVAEDVLTIINYINAGHPDDVASGAAVGGPYGFLDVTGDGHVVAEDVIEVINYINAGHPTEGEAQDQASSATQSAASTPHTESAASVPSKSFAPPVTTSPTAAPDLNESLLLLLASDASLAKKRR